MDEEKKKAKDKKQGCLIFIFVILVIVGILAFLGVFKEEAPTSSIPELIDLKAQVRFTGTQFVITNNNNFNWTSVELEINPGVFKSGYKLKAGLMEKGETYTVGAMQFAKPDGTRFNPFQIKPQSISIMCNTPRGKGAYEGSWE